MSQVLQSKLDLQIQQLMKLVLSEAKQEKDAVAGSDALATDVAANNTGAKLPPEQRKEAARDWTFVLRVLEEKLISSQRVKFDNDSAVAVSNRKYSDSNSNHYRAVLETLQVDAHEPPLLINPALLNTVSQRLID